MSLPELLSTTGLSTSETYTLVEVRRNAFNLIEEGRIIDSLYYLSYILFSTNLAEKSAAIRQGLLRIVWKRIELHAEDCFNSAVDSMLEFVRDAADNEWLFDTIDLAKSAGSHAASDLLQERKYAIEFGKCGALIEMMYARNGELSESTLYWVIARLQSFCD